MLRKVWNFVRPENMIQAACWASATISTLSVAFAGDVRWYLAGIGMGVWATAGIFWWAEDEL
mgnify:CR=1 FL=1